MIKIINKHNKPKNIKTLCNTIVKQMDFIESNTTKSDNIENIVDDILENDCTIFFVYYSEDEGEIYGFCFGNICLGLETGGKYLWMNELYVESEYRRNKIGTKIIEYVEEWCKKKNVKYIASMTENKNKESQQFFEKNNYELNKIIWIDKTIAEQKVPREQIDLLLE